MRAQGIRGAYVAATEGVPLPPRAAEPGRGAGWAVCGRCDLKTRPGAFHICIIEAKPAAAASKPMPKRKRQTAPVTRNPRPRCECGAFLKTAGAKQCRACFVAAHPRPECGTAAGYQWHRRQAWKDPGAHPWPLPADATCGCREAISKSKEEDKRKRRGTA